MDLITLPSFALMASQRHQCRRNQKKRRGTLTQMLESPHIIPSGHPLHDVAFGNAGNIDPANLLCQLATQQFASLQKNFYQVCPSPATIASLFLKHRSSSMENSDLKSLSYPESTSGGPLPTPSDALSSREAIMRGDHIVGRHPRCQRDRKRCSKKDPAPEEDANAASGSAAQRGFAIFMGKAAPKS